MAKRAKKYKALAEKIDRLKNYELKEALGLAKESCLATAWAGLTTSLGVDLSVLFWASPMSVTANEVGGDQGPIVGVEPLFVVFQEYAPGTMVRLPAPSMTRGERSARAA